MNDFEEFFSEDYEFIGKIADEYNVKVRLRALEEDTRGYIIDGEIVLNRFLYPERRNWTFCHELGHLVLGHSDHPSMEEDRAADRFAAELMLPEGDFMRDSRCRNLEELKRIYPHASYEAIARRLGQFQPVVMSIFDDGQLTFRGGSPQIVFPQNPFPEELAIVDRSFREKRSLEESSPLMNLKAFYIDQGREVVRVILISEPQESEV